MNSSQRTVLIVAVVAAILLVAFQLAVRSPSKDRAGDMAEGVGAIVGVALILLYTNRSRSRPL